MNDLEVIDPGKGARRPPKGSAISYDHVRPGWQKAEGEPWCTREWMVAGLKPSAMLPQSRQTVNNGDGACAVNPSEKSEFELAL